MNLWRRGTAIAAVMVLVFVSVATVQPAQPASAAPLPPPPSAPSAVTGLPSNCTSGPAPDGSHTQVTCTFGATGAVQTWQVPAGVSRASVWLAGGQGGGGVNDGNDSHGGYGGSVSGTVAVSGGQTYNIWVGGQGAKGSSGGGWPDGGPGGDAHTSRTSGCGGGGSTRIALAGGSLVAVAAGGGGCGGATDSDYGVEGGNGGSPGSGGRDAAWQSDGTACNAKGTPGGGGTTSGGGGAGHDGEYLSGIHCPYGASGTQPSGGGYLQGGTGGAGQGGASGGGGGGGGGYYGGGGGGGGNKGAGGTGGGGAGGGGANWYSGSLVSPSTGSGVRTGNGAAIVSYQLANTTTSVTATPPAGSSVLTVGTPFTLSATVMADSSNIPYGDVAFVAVQGGVSTPICTGASDKSSTNAVINGAGSITVTCSPTLSRGGSTRIDAAYTPGGSGSGGPAATASNGSSTVNFQPIATSTTLAKSISGSFTDLTATVSTTDASVALSGTVTFSSGDVPAGCLALPVTDNHDGTATVTCELHVGPGTDRDYIATYTGDQDSANSVSQPLHLSVGRLSSTTALSLGTTSASYGQPVTATATVTSVGGSAAFDGTVTFRDTVTGGGTTDACSSVAIVDLQNGTGQAQCTWTPGGGSHTVSAVYAGGTQVDASSSPPSPTLTVAKATPVLILTANPPGGSVAGQQVALTVGATAGGTPLSQGSATFLSGGTAIPGCTDVPIVSGSALCTLVPGAGDRTFTVTTSATADLNMASAPLSGASKIYHVGLHPTTTDLALVTPDPAPATIAAGGPVTVSATVGGVWNPTGSITFVDNGQPVTACTASPLSNGVATCTWTPGAGATHSVTAAYSGSITAAWSASTTSLTFTTGRFVPGVTISTSPSGTLSYGTATTLRAAVTSPGPAPTGSVTFTDNGSTIVVCGTPTVASATCTFQAGPGAHVYRAVYSGDTQTAPATSSAVSSTVGSLATAMTFDVAQASDGLTLSADVTTPSDPSVSPTGTVAFTVDGAAACSVALGADPTGGATGSCKSSVDASAGHTVAATFTATDPTAFGTATASATYAPAASCPADLATLVGRFSGSGTLTISAGALGTVSVTPTGSVGPCTGTTSLGVQVSASLFNGTLTATGVTGSITAGGGFCLDAGTFSLPSAWHVPSVSISTPICFTLDATGSIAGIDSGGLTASMPAGAFPFVAFPNAPPTSVSLGFTTDGSTTTIHAGFLAGPPDNPIVALSFDVASDGSFSGSLTTPGLTVLGQSLSSLQVTVSGGIDRPLRFDGSVTLGPIQVAPGLTISTVTVTVSNDGFSLAGTADVGVAGHTLSLSVAGSVSDAKNWNLALSSSDGPSWEPISGLQIQPDFSGTITSTDGTITWSISAGTGVAGNALATWSPAPGATITVDSVTLERPTTTCAAVPDGADDLALSFSGSLALNDTTFAIEGCVDLSIGAFHVEAGSQDVAITSGMSLTDAHLTVDAAVSGAFHVVGGATATISAGGTDHSLAVSFDFSSDGTFVVGASVDLASWGVPVQGYVAYASNSVTGFDTGDPSVGDGGVVDLAAGLTAVAVWTPGSSTADLLSKAGFTLGDGGAVTVVATLSPSAEVTFHAELAAPDGMPFLQLPGGASLTGVSLDWADGTLTLTVDGTIPMPDGAPDAAAHLEVVIGTADGTFSGTASLTGLSLFGQTLDLTGTVTGTRPNGSLVIDASVTVSLPGPIQIPGVEAVTLTDLSVTLGTSGVAVGATMSVAGRTGLTIEGTLASMNDWSLTVRSGELSWTPAPQVTIDAQLTGTISREAGAITFDLSATSPSGHLVVFTPVDGFSFGIDQIRLGNAPPPEGCRVAAAGNIWLFVEGSATLQLGPVSGGASASGCFDLTAGQVAITADASQMQLTLLDGAVVISGPKISVSRTKTGYAVDAQVGFDVNFPGGGTLSTTATLSLRSGGVFIVGVRTNLSQWLGSAGGNAYLYYSSVAVRGYDTGDPTIGKINLVSGITFAVKITLPTSVSGELEKIGLSSPGGATLAAVGTLDLSTKVFTLKIVFDAGLDGQTLFTTGSGVSLSLDSGYLKLTVSAGSVSFGLGLEATLHTPSATAGGEASDVPLIGEITISTTEFSVSLQLGDCHAGSGWQNAFGVEGLTVQCAAVQGGVSFEGPPLPSFGLMGTITSLPSNVADTVGYVNGSPMSFAFNLDPFLLSISIGTQDSQQVALRPLTMFGAPDAMQVYYASLYISPTGATIGQEVYPAGFGFGFQASIAGVAVSVLAKIDPVKMSISFDGSVSKFSVGPLTIGPVSLHFKASPSTFEFTFDGSLQLGPGEVDLGLIKIGGSLSASVHLSVSTSAISAWFTATVSAYVSAYLSHETCYYKGVLPYPCEWSWDKTGFDFTLGKTGFTLDSSGLTISFDGYSLTLPFDGSSPTTDVAFHGDTPSPTTALWDPSARPSIDRVPETPPPVRVLTA